MLHRCHLDIYLNPVRKTAVNKPAMCDAMRCGVAWHSLYIPLPSYPNPSTQHKNHTTPHTPTPQTPQFRIPKYTFLTLSARGEDVDGRSSVQVYAVLVWGGTGVRYLGYVVLVRCLDWVLGSILQCILSHPPTWVFIFYSDGMLKLAWGLLWAGEGRGFVWGGILGRGWGAGIEVCVKLRRGEGEGQRCHKRGVCWDLGMQDGGVGLVCDAYGHEEEVAR